jgi:hypothetical protein
MVGHMAEQTHSLMIGKQNKQTNKNNFKKRETGFPQSSSMA